MAKYESEIKYVPYSQERVYTRLADLTFLKGLEQNVELIREKSEGKVENVTVDSDSLTLTVQGMNVTLRIVEREPLKCIKFEGDKSPIPLRMWIQMLPVTSEQAKLKVTVEAEVNFFMKAMVAKPLKEAAEKLAEMLSRIPY
jgi:carbon monoxide dehydrogenase subunit G